MARYPLARTPPFGGFFFTWRSTSWIAFLFVHYAATVARCNLLKELFCAARGCPVVVEGFITTAAAMLAVCLTPQVKPYLIASHHSQERGHGQMLAWLELDPLLELDLRLGEGSGAALAMPLIEAACRLMTEMATFAAAKVSERAG